MNLPIKVSSLKKSFKQGFNFFELFQPHKRIEIFDDITFSLKHKEILCLVGPNGSGKTTLIKILAGLIIPDKGEVYYSGEKISVSSLRKVGVLLDDYRGFYWRLSVYHNLEFFGRLYGLGKKEIKQRVDYLCDFFSFDKPKKRYQELSLGQKQKVLFMRALLHKPSILLCDEPTKSLNYKLAHSVREKIKKMLGFIDAAIIVTHNINEAKFLANRIGLLDKGKLSIYKKEDFFTNNNA